MADQPKSVIEHTSGELALANDKTEEAHNSIATFARSNYVWPFSSGPLYRTPGVDRSTFEVGVLQTAVGAFRLNAGPLNLPGELSTPNRLGEIPLQHFIVQRDPAVDETMDRLRDTVESYGGALLNTMPVAAHVVRIDAAGLNAIREIPGIIATLPYQSAFKLDRKIGRGPLLDPNKALSEVYDLRIRVFEGEDATLTGKLIAGMGATVRSISGRDIYASVHRSQLAQVAGIEAVYMVWEDVPVILHGEETTTTMQTGRWNQGAIPYHDAGITGDGQVLMVLDTGVQLDAGDLSNTKTASGTAGVAHRKVVRYTTVQPFGGQGDLLGCDAPPSAGWTHGHLVAATAVGNATATAPAYGGNWQAPDEFGNLWNLDGVAPGAKVAIFDAQITPSAVSCDDPIQGAFSTSINLYDGGTGGALGDSYTVDAARIFNNSWGLVVADTYGAFATDVDDFLADKQNAMVFNSAGNQGNDTDNDQFFDPGSIQEPATSKNGLAIGASGNATDLDGFDSTESKAFFSSVGPVDVGGAERIAPQLMAPGQERGAMGVDSEFGCRSNDNDIDDPVECDIISGIAGTSFAAPAAAGAALLVRDYFAQGFYPDGTSSNPSNAADLVPDISGALVKALLVASADFMTGANLPTNYRFNNEQGYGRIQLDNVLPLETWPASTSGLIIHDAGITGTTTSDLSLGASIDATAPGTQNAQFEVCDSTQELRVALAWLESSSVAMRNDLDLQLTSPTGKLYIGNFFTDDLDRSGTLDTNNADGLDEDCDDFAGVPNTLDESRFSIAVGTTCNSPINSLRDTANPTELIVLSPNPDLNFDPDGNPILQDGTCPAAGNAPCGNDADCASGTCFLGTNQVEPGIWTVGVRSADALSADDTTQDYAVVITGGVCGGSSVRFDQSVYSCNEPVAIDVVERNEGTDALSGDESSKITARTTVEVWGLNVCDDGSSCFQDSPDCDGIGGGTCNAELLMDTETGASLASKGAVFIQDDNGSQKYTAEGVILTDKTAFQNGNGALDVRSGYEIRVTYADETSGSPDADKARKNSARVDCRVKLGFGDLVFGQFGQNSAFFVNGGCDTNLRVDRDGVPRPIFDFGFPDKYMDAGEKVILNVAFASNETIELTNAEVALKCVVPDGDSPEDCDPGSNDCADPTRANNTLCSQMTILNSPIVIGTIPPAAAVTPNFNIFMEDLIGTCSGDGTTLCTQNSPDCDGNGTCTSDTVEVEMVLEVTAAASGKSAAGVGVKRVTLNADEDSKFYSTDFPTGDTEIQDRQNNESIDNPTNNIGNFLEDYRFEERVWNDLTATGKNTNLKSPWNFDHDDGGFVSGITASTDFFQITDTIAQWGEDLNFDSTMNGNCTLNRGRRCVRSAGPFVCPDDPLFASCSAGTCSVAQTPGTAFDGVVFGADGTCTALEDRDPGTFAPAGTLDRNWSTRGGCGWQTRAPNTCSGNTDIGCYTDQQCADAGAGLCTSAGPATGGVWHTGRIEDTTNSICLSVANQSGQCQGYETVGGITGQLIWHELLLTPVIEKVNGPEYTTEILNWAWNQAVDLADDNVWWTWEFDTDTTSLLPIDLTGDSTVLNFGAGEYGTVHPASNSDLTDGYSMFANLVSGASVNGVEGGNHVGKNSCFFEGGAVGPEALLQMGLARPLDDDVQNGECGFSANASCSRICSSNTSVLNPVRCDVEADCTAVGESGCTLFTPDCRDITDTCTADADCVGEDGTPGGGDDGLCVDTDGICAVTLRKCNAAGDPACNANLPMADPDFDADDTCDNFADDTCQYSCILSTASIDEYVKPNGPIRNMDLFAFNGPDMRFTTLEDIYQDTGESFQGALGILNFEKESSSDPDPKAGFGIAVDDHVVTWREFQLIPDGFDCVTGASCATVDLQVSTLFEGNSAVQITVYDTQNPYGPPGVNNCNGNKACSILTSKVCESDSDCGAGEGTCEQDYSDVGVDVTDCDGDTVNDVVVLAQTDNEPAGELVVLNATGVAGEYTGTLPVSATYDVEGVLFAQRIGTTNPVITVTYEDLDYDGASTPCQNSIDPDAVGKVQAFTTLALSAGNVVVINTPLTDNGDNDGFADTGEEVNMFIRISNKTGIDLTGVTARLASNDPNIECISNSLLNIGLLEEDATLLSSNSFTFKVADAADRTTLGLDENGILSADLSVILFADQFDGTLAPQNVTLDLDLNASDPGAGPTSYFEGFEAASGFGSFTTMNLDAGQTIPGSAFIASDGYRCQYSNPDWINSNSYEQIDDCFIGATSAASDRYHWQVHTTDDIDLGRAYEGTQSLYFGLFSTSAADEHTTPASVLEAVRMNDPVNLGVGVCSNDAGIACATSVDCGGNACTAVSSDLTYKMQISLMDSRTVNAPFNESADRGVVAVQVADAATGVGLGDWIKLSPYQNAYDQQGTDIYTNCMFDPIDDGNTEDDWFDPADPFRRLGPSSTCFPEFSYVWLGDTFANSPFAENNIGNASDPPGLPGALGAGTWVESKVSLERFRGRRLRVRFLETALKLGTTTNWEAAFQNNPDPGDDGWWIDNIEVNNTLNALTPAVIAKDDGAPPASTTCDVLCTGGGGGGTAITAALVADPPGGLPAPGQVVELSAATSSGACVNGTLQYQFWKGAIGGGGTLLRAFTDNATISQSPTDNTTYFVEVRCSALPATCTDSTSLAVAVDCPGGGGGGAFPDITINAAREALFGSDQTPYDFHAGNLATLRASALPGDFAGAQTTLATSQVGPPLDRRSIAGEPNGSYFLFRGSGALGGGGAFCNSPSNTWNSTGSVRDLPSNGTGLP